MSAASAKLSDRNSSGLPLSFSDNFLLSPSGRRGHCVPILRMDVRQMSARNSSGKYIAAMADIWDTGRSGFSTMNKLF